MLKANVVVGFLTKPITWQAFKQLSKRQKQQKIETMSREERLAIEEGYKEEGQQKCNLREPAHEANFYDEMLQDLATTDISYNPPKGRITESGITQKNYLELCIEGIKYLDQNFRQVYSSICDTYIKCAREGRPNRSNNILYQDRIQTINAIKNVDLEFYGYKYDPLYDNFGVDLFMALNVFVQNLTGAYKYAKENDLISDFFNYWGWRRCFDGGISKIGEWQYLVAPTLVANRSQQGSVNSDSQVERRSFPQKKQFNC